MKLEEIQELWASDCQIAKEKLDAESLRIPLLHSKYLKLMSDERLRFKLLQDKRAELFQTLMDYFEGKIDGRDIGRSPWQLKETKAACEKRILADKEYIALNIKVYQSEEKVLTLKEIITSINQRNFIIKNAIDWFKWSQGNLV